MSQRKVSESIATYEAGFLALICLPFCIAYPTPPIARCVPVALSPRIPYPYFEYGVIVLVLPCAIAGRANAIARIAANTVLTIFIIINQYSI